MTHDFFQIKIQAKFVMDHKMIGLPNMNRYIMRKCGNFFLVSSIRTPVLIQVRLQRTETKLMHLKWDVTWTHGNQYILNGAAC